MIRTHILSANINHEVADYLNLSSGKIYTDLLVNHWRVMRKKKIWLSRNADLRISNTLIKDNTVKLHAHSIDAAQEGFYKACVTAKSVKRIDKTARYPHWTKYFRTTVWKQNAIKQIGVQLRLSNGLENDKINIDLPEQLQSVLRFLEVRLVYDKKSSNYKWHIVVENGIQSKINDNTNIVSVDLGEIHPAVVGDEQESTIILCRERRHEMQGHEKRLANLKSAISRKTKGSRRHKGLIHAKTRMKAKHKRVMNDIEHKVSRSIVDIAIERKAKIIAMGDVRNISKEVNLGKRNNQKIAGWNHGKIRKLVEYKAEAEGITVELVDERYTSQTCPNCGMRHKPKGRVYRCPSCGYQSHRDVVGQINILSQYKYGKVGKIAAPYSIKHRLPYDIRSRSYKTKTKDKVSLSVDAST